MKSACQISTRDRSTAIACSNGCRPSTLRQKSGIDREPCPAKHLCRSKRTLPDRYTTDGLRQIPSRHKGAKKKTKQRHGALWKGNRLMFPFIATQWFYAGTTRCDVCQRSIKAGDRFGRSERICQACRGY